jgi:hypothetical protein
MQNASPPKRVVTIDFLQCSILVDHQKNALSCRWRPQSLVDHRTPYAVGWVDRGILSSPGVMVAQPHNADC